MSEADQGSDFWNIMLCQKCLLSKTKHNFHIFREDFDLLNIVSYVYISRVLEKQRNAQTPRMISELKSLFELPMRDENKYYLLVYI
jgi:hypothetical protein